VSVWIVTAVRVLVDTNVLVYAHDRSEPLKQPRAADMLDLLRDLGLGALSVQCLTEFFSVVTRKYDPPMTIAEATDLVEAFSLSWPVFPLTPAIVLEAARGAGAHQLAFWDALIWAAARLNGVDIVLSEDFAHDRVVEGVRFVDPFRADLTAQLIEAWLA